MSEGIEEMVAGELAKASFLAYGGELWRVYISLGGGVLMTIMILPTFTYTSSFPQ